MNEEKLGQWLQAARLRANLTQQALCQKAGLSYSTLTKIERGAIKSPSIFTIQSIATALDVSLDQLMGVAPKAAGPKAEKHRSKSGISFVYFDINGCLIRFFYAAFTRLGLETGISPDVIETAFWHYNDQVCRGELSMEAFNRKFGSELHTEQPLDWMSYYMEAVEPIPAMQDLARWAGQNYRIGLLSNIMPGFIQELLRRGLLPNLDYDTIVDSSAVKFIKPESQIYTVATEMAHTPSNEILLVDDSRTNLMAAEKHGWRVLWFDDYRPDESVERVKSALSIAD